MNFLTLIIIPSIISFILFPVVIKFALKNGFIDDPAKSNHPAKLHKKTLPRMGGIAPFIAIFLTILIFLPLDKHLIGIILAGFILLLINTLDDKYDIHPLIRFGIEFIAASIIVISGVGISSLSIPFIGNINLNIIDIPINYFGEHHFFPLADILAVLWIMTVINFVNWSSGVDGQLPTLTIISLAFIALLASQFIGYDSSQWTIIKICLITIGAVIPFLIFNWHPARILPGDGASTFLALIIATLAIYSGSKTATTILILGVPIMDGLWTIGRRIYKGKLPIWGDREHLHHKLLDIGWTHEKITIFYGSITFILGLIAIYSSKVTKFWSIIITGILLIGLTLYLGFLGKKNPKAQHNG